jgi:hypothetical protein
MRILAFLLLIATLILFAGCTSKTELTTQETEIYIPPHTTDHEPQQCDSPFPMCEFRLESPPEPLPPINLHIALADDDFLATFANVHEVDDPRSVGMDWGRRVAFWSDVPLYDFALLQFYLSVEFLIFPGNTVGTIDVLPVGDVFVVNGSVDNATLPTSGVTFVDVDDNPRYFIFQHNHHLRYAPSPFSNNFLDHVVDGYVRIYAKNEEEVLWEFGYVAVDVDNFEPSHWWNENWDSMYESWYSWREHRFYMWDLSNSIGNCFC